MRGATFLFCLSSLSGSAAAAARDVGFFSGWGAFAQDRPRLCYAIARPEGAGARGGGTAAVAFRPGTGGAQLHIRLGRDRRPGAAATLRIGARAFQLAGTGSDLWATGAAADAAIVAAMRVGETMRVDTRAPEGSAIRHRYQLSGAASAIDAAAVACAPR